MMKIIKCQTCSKEFRVFPSREHTAKFCSNVCLGKWRAIAFIGEGHPRWKGGERSKVCQGCGNVFHWKQGKPFISWEKQKFCSKPCADKHGLRYTGEDHPLYNPNSRRKASRGKQGAWARAVFSRDKNTCQHCGATEIQLHAHHVKSFADYPDLRWDVDNGLTLCWKCHLMIHTALNENGVNSGKIQTGKAVDNPEPSFQGNLIEGVTTRGRAYRRILSQCEFCNKPISKALSDVKNKQHLFCSKSCAGKWRVLNGIAFRKRQ